MTRALAEFFALLDVAQATFQLPGARSFSLTGAGEVRTQPLGTALWKGRVTLAADTVPGMERAQALVEEVDRAGAPFFLHRAPLIAPDFDPAGAALTGFTPRLHTVGADPRFIRLAGLPVGYRLRRPDLLAFDYDGTRRALHKVAVAEVVADAQGVLPLFEVNPPLRPGFTAHPTTGAPVTLVRPCARALIVPNSIRWAEVGRDTAQGLAFDIIQTLGTV